MSYIGISNNIMLAHSQSFIVTMFELCINSISVKYLTDRETTSHIILSKDMMENGVCR